MSFSGNQYPNYADKVITTRGDIVRGSSTGARERLGLGSSTEVLTSDGTDIDWAAAGGAPTTTKGDLSGYSTTAARIPISTNNYSLFADSAQALGLKWAASPTSTLTTTGDLLYASGANTLARLASTTSGHILTAQGAGVAPVWAAAAAAGGGSLTLIDNTVLGSDATDIDTSFTALGQGTNMSGILAIFNGARSDTNGLYLNVNGIATATYDAQSIVIDGGAAAYRNETSQSVWEPFMWGNGSHGIKISMIITASDPSIAVAGSQSLQFSASAIDSDNVITLVGGTNTTASITTLDEVN